MAFGLAAFLGAFLVRFEGFVPVEVLPVMWVTMPFAVFLKSLSALHYGLVRELPHCVSADVALRILKAATASTVAFIIGIHFFFGEYGRAFPRSVIIIDYMLTVAIYGGSRFVLRMLRDAMSAAEHDEPGRHTLILGAGETGEVVLQSIRRDFAGVFSVVGFLDDDPAKRGMTLRGQPILGTIERAADVIKEYAVTEVIIAMPNVTKERMRGIVETCSSRNVNFRILPALRDHLMGDHARQQLRDVRLEDLLGRDSVSLDSTPVLHDVAGRRVMVTGAGGSIGSELARQLVKHNPESILLLDVAETPLFSINQDLREIAPNVKRVSLFADIKHRFLIDKIFDQYKPHRVYHAAAFKHVTMNEQYPVEAVFNNVLGTRNLVNASIRSGVEKFVLISTDKAIRPSSIMGATKRCAELLLTHMNELGTKFITVRFGNVLGSSGSVVPIFKRQIERGGPVTVTHPDVERYFMTIPEAAELVLQACALGHGGELFLLEMGRPVKIADLARNMIKLAGMEPGKDIEIQYTGLQPGEKLGEELVGRDERVSATPIPKLMLYERPDMAGMVREFMRDLADLEKAALSNNESRTVEALWKIVRRHYDEHLSSDTRFAGDTVNAEARRVEAAST